jgi:hypothetical protein
MSLMGTRLAQIALPIASSPVPLASPSWTILRELRKLGLRMKVLEQRSSPARDRQSDRTPTSAVRRPPSDGQINLEGEDEQQELNLGAASFARTPTPRKKTSFARQPQGGPRKSLGAALGGLIGDVSTDTDSDFEDDSEDSQYAPDVFQNLPRSRRSTDSVTTRRSKTKKTSNLEAAIHNGVVFMPAPESASNLRCGHRHYTIVDGGL